MVTSKQVEANRKNGARSTGPKTPAGKAASSGNSRKTGLLSRELILPGESREEFDALFDQLILEHKPVGVLEISLLERVAVAMWRQRRMVRAERAQIWKAQLSQTVEVQRKMVPDSHLPDHELALRYLESEPWVSHIDEFEKECRLFHLAIDFTFDRFRDTHPLLARVYYEPDPSMVDQGPQTIGGVYGDKKDANGIIQQQAMWLRAITQHREGLSIRDLMKEVNAIPPAAENLSRYQAALDNEWYKAMRAFREAQSYRLKTIEQVNPAKDRD
jgi:hypothetical protein